MVQQSNITIAESSLILTFQASKKRIYLNQDYYHSNREKDSNMFLKEYPLEAKTASKN